MKNFAKQTPNVELDDFDRAILQLVQHNNQSSHSFIGEHVGLSASAVRRRLQQLREGGVICQDVALVNAPNPSVTFIVTLSFASESIQLYQAFNKQMDTLEPVKQSYHVAGSEDYVVIVQGPSLKWYEQWSQDIFMRNAQIRRYDTKVVWSCKKFCTTVTV